MLEMYVWGSCESTTPKSLINNNIERRGEPKIIAVLVCFSDPKHEVLSRDLLFRIDLIDMALLFSLVITTFSLFVS